MPFDTATIEQFAKASREPAWLTEVRRQALARHHALPWPHPSDDIWRRTDITLLDPSKGFVPFQPSLLQGCQLSNTQLELFTRPLGDEQLFVRVNGTWLTPPQPEGFTLQELGQAAAHQPEPLRQLLMSDGLTEAEQKLTSLNAAFHHDDLVLDVPAGRVLAQPIRLVRIMAVPGQGAVFPFTLLRVGAGSQVTLIDEYVSFGQGGGTAAHLVNGRIELQLEPNAQVRYIRLQRLDAAAREFVLQRATLARGSSLVLANLTLGAAVSKTHVITKLTGQDASTRLYGFVFGKDGQHVDQHTLQDHQAPHTTSDLQYRAALQDHSRMVYTGLIRIAQDAKQTNAYQSNHNLMLSQEAKVETIPMLEILADDVQCKHGASIGPIDEEQLFYLRSRGIPREVAQRLVVMGFIEPIMQEIPFAPLQERLRADIASGLHE